MADAIAEPERDARIGIVAVRPDDWLRDIDLRELLEARRDLRLEFSLLKQLSAAAGPQRRSPASARPGPEELLEQTAASDAGDAQPSCPRGGVTVVSSLPCGTVFLATAGPKRRTASELWRAVLQHDVRQVFMLCAENECSEYLPSETEPTRLRGVADGDPDIEVWLLPADASVTQPPYAVPGLCHRGLRIASADREVRVDHFHYRLWPDNDVPPLDAVLALESMASLQPPGAVLVHCRAGLGRTGAFVAICLAIASVKRQLAEQPQRLPTLSVLRTVLDLRAQRPGMVQTVAQYRLIYDTLTLAVRRLLAESPALSAELSDARSPSQGGVQPVSTTSSSSEGVRRDLNESAHFISR